MYLLDANVFIEAKDRYYRMSTFSGYWDWLDTQFQSGELCSIEMVYDEVSKSDDNFSSWIKSRREYFLNVDDAETQSVFTNIAQSVMENSVYKDTEKAKFLGVADPFLIAKAKTLDAVIVTHEVLVPENSTKVKIPNICRSFDIKHLNTFELLELLNAKFVLASQ